MRCIVEGCTDDVLIKKRQLCPTHYQRWRKHGDPTVTKKVRWEGQTCRNDGCVHPVKTKGLCSNHYKIWLKNKNEREGKCKGCATPLETDLYLYCKPCREKYAQHQRNHRERVKDGRKQNQEIHTCSLETV